MLVGPGKESGDKSVIVGQAAHISAAQPGGPRFAPTMTAEERRSALKNGIWMCGHHADLIDKNNGSGYATELLWKWRDLRESEARSELEGVAATPGGPGSDEPVPVEHRDELRAVAGEVSRWVEIQADIRWPRPPSVVRAFRRHFPELAIELDRYDQRIAERDVIARELCDEAWALAKERHLDQDPFNVNPLFLYGVVCDQARLRPVDDSDPVFHEVLEWLHIGAFATINLATSQNVGGDKAKVIALLKDARSKPAFWELASEAQDVLVAPQSVSSQAARDPRLTRNPRRGPVRHVWGVERLVDGERPLSPTRVFGDEG